ncbi:hypothetical protein Sjap_015254 [Stephania japonica]|uniref:Uncharacterized protein n=1 Tax=Stephania japonica TaxID=461633 RepID=A0AAP0IJ20_9MAGN
MNAIPLESVEVNEITSVEDYWSERMEELEVSPSEPDIIIAHNEEDEAENEIEVIFEWPEELQIKSKEDQPLVLVKPPTLPCIPIEFKKGVIPNELLILKADMPISLSNAIDAPFVVDISKGEGIM